MSRHPYPDDSYRKLLRQDGVLLHRQLFLVLRSAIQSGQYRRGDIFPTEEMLARAYAVSRATVRRTLVSLEGAGFIDRRQGASTRVAGGASFMVEDSALEAHLRTVGAICNHTQLDLLLAEPVEASTFVCTSLGLEAGTTLLLLKRVRSQDEVPIWYSFAYLSPRLADRLDPVDLARLSIHELVESAGMTLGEVDQTVGACATDADMVAALEVQIGTPLLETFNLYIDDQGEPVSFQRTYTPPERRRLHIARRAEKIDSA